MSIKKINEFPVASGVNLTPDDVFLFMDDPNGSAETKKVSLSTLSNVLGTADTGEITFDGVKIIGSVEASGYGGGYGTIELVPDNDLYNNHQYLVIDPTGPNHIHLRAGGSIDSSNAELIIGGEKAQVKVLDSSHEIKIHSGSGQTAGSFGFVASSIGVATLSPVTNHVNDVPPVGAKFTIDGIEYTIQSAEIVVESIGFPPNQSWLLSVNATFSPYNIPTSGTYNWTFGSPIKEWTFNNDGDLEIPGNILLNNGTSLAKGTFDNNTGGQNGISLNCAVGYELNWQGGRLKSTYDNGVTASPIYVDSPMSVSPVTVEMAYNSTINVDAKYGDMFDITLTGNATLANPTNPVNGKTLRWRISQDSTGGRTITLGNKFNIPSSASSPLPWSTSPNKMDILAATYHAGRDKWDVIAFVPGY